MKTNSNITNTLECLSQQVGANLNWRADERFNALLTEFAENRSDDIDQQLSKLFNQQWHHKNIKKAPKYLQAQIYKMAKVKKGQIIYSQSQHIGPHEFAALWWPWDHGGTISVRLVQLSSANEYTVEPEKKSLFSQVKSLLFNR